MPDVGQPYPLRREANQVNYLLVWRCLSSSLRRCAYCSGGFNIGFCRFGSLLMGMFSQKLARTQQPNGVNAY
jgi:hypothetical protein